MLQLGSDFTFGQEPLNKGNMFKKLLDHFLLQKIFGHIINILFDQNNSQRAIKYFYSKEHHTCLGRPIEQIWRRFIFKVRKSLGNQILEELLLSFVGADCDYDEFINGIVCHTKKGFIQMALWVKDIKHNMDAFTTIEKWLKDSILQLKEDRDIEFAFHPLT